MTTIRQWLARLRDFFVGSGHDASLQDEIRTHLDLLTDDFLRRGLTPDAAQAAARRAFGGVDQMTERYRDQRGLPWVESLWQDVRFARRALVAHRGVTSLAVAGLGLGIGVSMGFITIVNAICVRGLPIPRPDRILFVSSQQPGGAPGALSFMDFVQVRDHAPGFASTAAYAATAVSLADDGLAPDRVSAAYMSAAGFPILDARPIVGRALSAEDEIPGAPLAAMLGASLWRSRYNGDPRLIGRQVRIDGWPTTIIGVVADDFKFPGQAELWLPLSAMPGLAGQPRAVRSLSVFGRLVDGATLEGARAELASAAVRLDEATEAAARGTRFLAVPINEHVNGNIFDTVWIAFITAGLLVLIVSCANVANLLLMRASRRTREMALRLSLGATRWRLVRQLAVESAVLAGLGGLTGLALAVAGVRLLAAATPAAAPLPYWIRFTLDGRLLVVFVALCTISVFLFGLVPALLASRAQANDLLKDGGRQTPAHLKTRWWTSAFLAVELALTIVLLSNVALGLDLGPKPPTAGIEVDPAPLLTARVTLPAAGYATPDARLRFYARLDEGLSALEGVRTHTTAAQVLGDGGRPMQLTLESQPTATNDAHLTVRTAAVGPDYFATLGVPLSAGRDLSLADAEPGHLGLVINQRFAEVHLGGHAALGQRLQLAAPNAQSQKADWLTIVGVAVDIAQGGPRVEPMAYQLDRVAPPASAALLLRVSASPEALVPVVRRLVAEIDPDLPLYRVVTMRQAIDEAGWNGRVSSGILNTISTIASLLTLLGLYAVTAHLVEQRRPEISVRMALGATPRAIRWLVLRRALFHVALGLALGAPATIAFMRVFAGGSVASGPAPGALLLLPVGIVVVIVSLVASLVPAMRAARIDPLASLRVD